MVRAAVYSLTVCASQAQDRFLASNPIVCCWSQWGDASGCGGFPGVRANGEPGRCNNDYTRVCSSETDCTAPATVHAPVPEPVHAPVPEPVHAPVPAVVHAPVPAVVHAPVPTVVHAPVPAVVHAPVPGPVHPPVPEPIPAPVPAPIPAPTPACTDHRQAVRNCAVTGCCVEPSFSCFLRDSAYGECHPACPGATNGWSCVIPDGPVTPGVAHPVPAPVHVPVYSPSPAVHVPSLDGLTLGDPCALTACTVSNSQCTKCQWSWPVGTSWDNAAAGCVCSEWNAHAPAPMPVAPVVPAPTPVVPVVPGQTAVQQYGQLLVQGKHIFDQSGQHMVQLKGVSLSAVDRSKMWTADVVNWLVDDWKVNLIRIPVFVEKAHEGSDYIEDLNEVKNALQVVVDAAIAKGVYAMVSFHMDPLCRTAADEPTVCQELIAVAQQFFTSMGQLYGSTPNILFEPYNEPTTESWSGAIKPVHEQLVPLIRQYSDNLIVLGTGEWSQRVDEAAQDPLSTATHNLVYALHFFAYSHTAYHRSLAQQAVDLNLPVFASSWGVCAYNGGAEWDESEVNLWTQFFDNNHISNAVWAVNDAPANTDSCAMLVEGASTSGGWQNHQISATGQYIRGYIRGDRQAPITDGNPVVDPPIVQYPVASGDTPVARHGQLYVLGNRIMDQNNQPVQLHGVSYYWSQWSRFMTTGTTQWLANDWDIDVIRIAMGVRAARNGYMDWTHRQSHLDKVNTVVEAAIQSGIYVIIDWHIDRAGAFQLQAEAKSFFIEMAQKWGHYPNVMFEPFNEPLDTDAWYLIKRYHEDIVPAIRQYSNNIVILGSRSWSQDVDEAARDPVHGHNLVYALHFYAMAHRNSYREKAQFAIDQGLALFATEWGVCSWNGGRVVDWPEVKRWTDFFQRNWISQTVWALNENSLNNWNIPWAEQETCSLLNPTASDHGGWSHADLTETGTKLKNYIKGLPY